MNVAQVLVDSPAVTHPDRLALVTDSSRVSCAALARLTNRLGRVLRDLGCGRGDRIVIAVPESAESVAALFAALKIGALAVPVPPGGSIDDFAIVLRDLDAAAVIAAPGSLDAVLAATARTSAKVIALADADARVSARVDAWRTAVDAASPELDADLVSPDDPALVLYTSGSTGRQKAAVHCHRALLAAAERVGRDTFGMQPTDRVFSTARQFFAFGLGFGVLMPLAVGATAIVSPTRDLRELARLISDKRATILCGVPTLLDALLRASRSLVLDWTSVRFVVSAGEPLPAVVYDGYRERFGIDVLDGIGSTEMLTHFITNRPGQSRRASCGTPVAGCEVSLVDDDGRPVADDEIGHLRVSGETRFLGYWQHGAVVQGAHVEAVGTGDRMFRDPDGGYHFCGRSDDMLKIAGMWVSPHEIESVLRSHADLAECAVTTREDRDGRRRLVAYVVPRPAIGVRSSTLYRFAAERLPEHMRPAAFVVLSALPRTPNGKLKRPALPEPAWPSMAAAAGARA